jgi:hypothetical protein
MDRIKDLTPTDPDKQVHEGDVWRVRYRPKDHLGADITPTTLVMYHKYGTTVDTIALGAFTSGTNDDGPYLYTDVPLGPGYNTFTLEMTAPLQDTDQFRIKAIPKFAQPSAE